MQGVAAAMTLDERMQRFRIARGELYNNFFAVPDPWNNDGWIMAERFAEVEQVLFRKLVFEPTPEGMSHGCAHFDVELAIQVVLNSPFCPIMINRAIDSPYWDHPIKEVTPNLRAFAKPGSGPCRGNLHPLSRRRRRTMPKAGSSPQSSY
jgi:hypothetical protein